MAKIKVSEYRTITIGDATYTVKNHGREFIQTPHYNDRGESDAIYRVVDNRRIAGFFRLSLGIFVILEVGTIQYDNATHTVYRYRVVTIANPYRQTRSIWKALDTFVTVLPFTLDLPEPTRLEHTARLADHYRSMFDLDYILHKYVTFYAIELERLYQNIESRHATVEFPYPYTMDDFRDRRPLAERRVRDTGRQKLYDAERCIWDKKSDDLSFDDILSKLDLPFDVQLDVKHYARSHAANAKWGAITTVYKPNPEYDVMDFKSRVPRSLFVGWAIYANINIGKARMDFNCIALWCHELAHSLTPQQSGWKAHGKEYATVYLWVVYHIMGRESYDKLKNAFLAAGIPFLTDKVI